MPTPVAVNQSEKRAKRELSRQFVILAKEISDRIRYEEKGMGDDINKIIDNAF